VGCIFFLFFMPLCTRMLVEQLQNHAAGDAVDEESAYMWAALAALCALLQVRAASCRWCCWFCWCCGWWWWCCCYSCRSCCMLTPRPSAPPVGDHRAELHDVRQVRSSLMDSS